MNSIEEQMQMLDLEVATKKAKTKSEERASIPFSERNGSSGAIQGSFTGAVVQPTMQTRQGRPLLASGIRIFDDMVINEVNKTKTK